MLLRKEKTISICVTECEKFDKIYKEIYFIVAEKFSVVKRSSWKVFNVNWKFEFLNQMKIWKLRN